jgi:putative oxidoreductase
MSGLLPMIRSLWKQANTILDRLSAFFLLATRLYIADVFISSGLTKIRDFSTTVALFENEYKVPVLSPMVAALAGTAAELVLPTLLALGLASRPAAVALFVFNIVACLSYPDIMPAGIVEHMMWGFMMLVILFHGPGWVSLDRWVQIKYLKKYFP